MQNMFRKLFSRTGSAREEKETAKDSLQGVDPRVVGYRDAVNSGWYQRETGELLKGFPIEPQDTVLDVGCGEGLSILFCANQGAHVVFTDVNPRKIEHLKEKAQRSPARKVEAYVSDSLPLPIPDGYATKVLAMDMLEHTEDPAAIVKELYRVGKPGAQYLISVPGHRSELLQKPFASSNYFTPPNHIQVFDKKRLLDLVESAGMVVESYTTWGFYWVMWMSIYWCLNAHEVQGEIMERISKPPYHGALMNWAKTWDEILKLPDVQPMLDSFNRELPKSQAVIARKPE